MQEDVAEAELVPVAAEVFLLQMVAKWKDDSVVGESVLEVQLEAEI